MQVIARKSNLSQHGAALVVSLVMLVVITLIGVMAMRGSHLEWLMTNNTQFQSDAYRNATIARGIGLNCLSTAHPMGPCTLPSTSSNFILPPNTTTNPAKWNSGAFATTSVTTPNGTGKYVIEYFGCSVYDYNNAFGSFTFFSGGGCGATTHNIIIQNYRVWAYGGDAKGASRILSSNFANVIYSNPAALLPSRPLSWMELE